jgi:hypothetical protein
MHWASTFRIGEYTMWGKEVRYRRGTGGQGLGIRTNPWEQCNVTGLDYSQEER